MTLGKVCETHQIPRSVCSACRGASEERKRIMERMQYLLETGYKGNDLPDFDSGVRQALTILIQELAFADEL